MSETSKQTPRPSASDFQKSSRESASSPAPENFKFEREDWTLFRTVDGLQQKAGVPKSKLRRLVLKELADNAHDTGTQVRIGNHSGGYFIENDGAGMDGTPEEIARAFSIARPLVSTKLLRLPTRGALGNGLRVVAGAVLASGGSLTVISCDRRIVPVLDGTINAAGKVVRKAHRPTSGDRPSQKNAVIDNLETVIADVSGGGKFRFNARQLFYGLRPLVMDETGEELKIGNFTTIITDYENEHGEIASMYREPRGSIYHPHREETITLGTLMVEEYERPAWTYNKLLYIEKEGFNEALQAARWSERHDCMLMSSKGFSTRAARDLVDALAEHDEPVTIFCVHDADAYGTMIYQTFQEATKARGARKIRIVNLGLEPWEATDMGLEVETLEASNRRKAVADYVREQRHGNSWEEWLQTHRVELNAMTTPQFIEWLDQKMAAYDKLVPPPAVLESELDDRIEQKIRDAITERVLREANIDAQVTTALAEIGKPDADTLTEGVKKLFEEEPESEWRDHIEAVATELADAADHGGMS